MGKALSRFLGGGLRSSLLERRPKSVQVIAPEDGESSREATPKLAPAASGAKPFSRQDSEQAHAREPPDERFRALSSSTLDAERHDASGVDAAPQASTSGALPVASVNVSVRVSPSPSPPPSPAPRSPKLSHNQDDLSDDRSDVLVDLPAPTLPVDWSKGNKLGSGSFGQVYQGLNNRTGARSRRPRRIVNALFVLGTSRSVYLPLKSCLCAALRIGGSTLFLPTECNAGELSLTGISPVCAGELFAVKEVSLGPDAARNSEAVQQLQQEV